MAGFKPQEILCLVDLSPASGAVMSWARLFAQAFSANVEVLHAAEPSPFVFEGREQIQSELARTELHAAIGGLAQDNLGAVPYRIVVEEGHPVQVVIARLQRHVPQLIIMGSHGHDGMARVMLGSVAENVVRLSPCPMLIVKGSERVKPLQRILCPVNLTASAAECAQAAGILAAVLKARLEVMLALEDAEPGSAAGQQLHVWIPDSLRRLCEVSETVAHGDAAEKIVEQSRQAAPDLIVLAAEHRPFLEFTTLGRTTERVMRYSPCTVLLLPRRPGSSVSDRQSA